MRKLEKGYDNNISFVQSIKKFEELLSKLENNDISLEDSISAYREGVQLLESCRRQLEEAQMLVTVEDVPEEM